MQKFIFQLCWRDYFHFYFLLELKNALFSSLAPARGAHFGRSVFLRAGPALRDRPWRRDPQLELRWKEGRTGVPLVDALMRELLATGFMANRGRHSTQSRGRFHSRTGPRRDILGHIHALEVMSWHPIWCST